MPRTPQQRFDVLGLGCTAVDDLLYVDAYPPADAKLRVRRRERQCGGLTATALVAAARLGARCAYAGVLGDDEDSRFVLDTLTREGIDTSHVLRRKHARPIRSVILVDETHKTRNIFYDTTGVIGASPDGPSEKTIRASRVLFVDLWGIDGMIRAARIARAAGIPIVGDLERRNAPRFRELFRLIDHLIVPEDFACSFTGARAAASAATKLWRKECGVVVVTCGARGCCVATSSTEKPTRFSAFKVRVADTTGCGDVFHGAYAAALAFGWPLAERIRFAAAAAALKATKPGGQAGIPLRSDLEKLLTTRRDS